MNSNEVKKDEHSRWCRRKFLFLPLILVAIAAKVGVFMVIWNHLIPDLFHGPLLTYWHALGLLILAKLLVGGFRPFGHRHPWHFGHHGRWAHMSSEEREKLREEIRKRFHD